ncbi:GNAT family N-acetyltransferase [Streptomyces sp. NPDC014734]|uniref:GNAT family N-acetyltransferase n=1 Tax=Streptomyces sp. NPDC014734 TaxID=3364886 RepID=UPI0036FD8BFC
MNSDREALTALFDRELRERARPDSPGVRVERTADVVRQVGAGDDWNGVVWSAPDIDPARVDAVIASQVDHFTALGHTEFEWKLYAHDRPACLAERLLAGGFEAQEPETVMVARVADLSAAVELPEGVRLRRVRDADDVELMARAHERAFGSDASWLRHRASTLLAGDPDGFVGVLAMAGDEPVSSARMETCPGTAFAGLWGGGTAPQWRGRGIYRALVAHRARIAAERGFGFLQVDASEQSRPILRRLGFLDLSTTTPFVFRARPHRSH